jgi:hypothetical protein
MSAVAVRELRLTADTEERRHSRPVRKVLEDLVGEGVGLSDLSARPEGPAVHLDTEASEIWGERLGPSRLRGGEGDGGVGGHGRLGRAADQEALGEREAHDEGRGAVSGKTGE